MEEPKSWGSPTQSAVTEPPPPRGSPVPSTGQDRAANQWFLAGVGTPWGQLPSLPGLRHCKRRRALLWATPPGPCCVQEGEGQPPAPPSWAEQD